MKIEYISSEGLDTIKENQATYLPLFLEESNEALINSLRKDNFLLDSGIDCPNLNLDMTYKPEMKRHEYEYSDFKNIKKMHEILIKPDIIPPAIAVKEGFWAGLAITHCWDFMKFRCAKYFKDEQNNSKKKKKKTNSLIGAFLPLSTTGKRYAFVQCIARLYWTAQYIYDTNNEKDPFWALSKVFSHTGLAGTIMPLSSSNLSANKDISLGLLDAASDFIDEGFKLKRDKHMTYSVKYLNAIGGTMLLDTFSRKEIRDLIFDRLILVG